MQTRGGEIKVLIPLFRRKLSFSEFSEVIKIYVPTYIIILPAIFCLVLKNNFILVAGKNITGNI